MKKTLGLIAIVAILVTVGSGTSSAVRAPSAIGNEPRIDYSTRITAEKNGGIRTVGGYSLPPSSVISSLRPTVGSFRSTLGIPLSFTQLYREGCRAKYRDGLWLDFWSLGFPVSCSRRWLQIGFVYSAKWRIQVGNRAYRIGMPKRRIPKGSRFIPGQGYTLALARRDALGVGSVSAKVKRGKIKSFYLIFGYAGE